MKASVGDSVDETNYIITDVTDNKVYINVLADEEANDVMISEIVDEDHLILHEVDGFLVTVACCLK